MLSGGRKRTHLSRFSRGLLSAPLRGSRNQLFTTVGSVVCRPGHLARGENHVGLALKVDRINGVLARSGPTGWGKRRFGGQGPVVRARPLLDTIGETLNMKKANL